MNLDKIFHLKENHTDVKTEVMAGITTFMTMAYILAVNPNILSASGMDRGSVFTATALSAFIATCLMALLSNYPFVLAPGMGLNAYFTYTVVLGMGYTWQQALAAVFAEGIIFILLSLTNVREAIFNSIPMNLKHAVSVGIGLFIAFIGLQNAKIVVGNDSTLVSIFSFKSSVAEGTFSSQGITVLLALIGILVTAVGKRCQGKYSLGHPDHLGSRNHLPADTSVCTKCRHWLLQPASRFFKRNFCTKYGSNLYENGFFHCILTGFRSHHVCIPVC